MNLVTPKEFAQVFDISDRAARSAFSRALEGGKWRGYQIPVTEIASQRGGVAGKVKALLLDRCTPDLKALLTKSENHSSFAPYRALYESWQIEHQQARLAVIRPILETRKGTSARTAAIDAATMQKHEFLNSFRALSRETIRGWVLGYERDGICGLIPKGREDKGKGRVLVSRAWDAGIDLSNEIKTKIVEKVTVEARSMVSNDGTSIREVLRLAGNRLSRCCVDYGSQLPPSKLKQLCKLNHKWAERQGLKQFNLIYRHDKDHKAWQDQDVPRIRRDLHAKPMGLLVGDVHYVDIIVEENAEPVRVRLIAWMDASSLFTWVTPVFLPKGKGVRQEDIAASLAQVALCPHGGIPQEYYLDNGSEYGQIASSMVRLSTLSQMKFGVTLAKPYSPTSKGEIEGFFDILENIFKGLPGWIGGDRTNKKSVNKGKVVAPYRDGLAQLEKDIRAAVAVYNDRSQSGRLHGLSPLEMLERKIKDTSFVARVPSQEAFDLIFSKSGTRSIRQGMITFANSQWHSPEFAVLPSGTSVEILIPLRNERNRLFVRHKDLGDGCWAEPEQIFEQGDRAGAKRQAELERGKRNVVHDLKRQIDPHFSTFQAQKEAVTRIAPDAPAPEFWTQAIDKTVVPPSVAELDAKEDKQRRSDLEEFLAICGKAKREISGGNH